MAITDAEVAELESRGYITMRKKKVVLTDAQIKALPTTPVDIIPAPGAGKSIVVLLAEIYAGPIVSYTNIGDKCLISLQYGSFGAGLSSLFNADGPSSSATELLVNAGYFRARLAVVPSGPFNTDQSAYEATLLNDTPDRFVNTALSFVIGNYNTASFTDIGNLTGGDSSNSITVSVAYFISEV